MASLQGFDGASRAIDVGTLSKALRPELRIGHPIAPAGLVPAFRTKRPALDVSPPAS